MKNFLFASNYFFTLLRQPIMATLLPGNIVYAGAATMETENYRSLGHFLTEKLKGHGDKVLMIDGITGQQYTAKTIYQAVVRMAYVLQKLGVKSGEVVGLCSENRYEAFIVIFAAFALNATVAPLNNTYTDRETHHAVNLSKPKVMFASKQTIERIIKISKKNTFIKHIVMFGLLRSNSKILSYNELMESPRIAAQNDFFCNFANKYADVALILCSSGTTGLPKGVMLTQLNVMTAADKSSVEMTDLPLGDTTCLLVLPAFHVFGCLLVLSAAGLGTTSVFLPKFEPHSFLSSIEKYRVELLYAVPPIMVFLAKHEMIEKYNLSSLKMLYCGAAPLSKETEDQLKARLGISMIRQGYGLSETTRGITVQSEKFCKPGSVGELKKGLYAKVIDVKTGKALGPNQRGELCFKGHCIMKGYIATKETIRNGWIHTGDIGYFDDGFEFYVVDRIKELIKYKAFQVPPAELEALLLTMTKVKDAAVIGKPDERAGELPLAFVVKQPNVELTEAEVIQYVANRVSQAKRLHGGVIFIDEIPKSPSGKILRRVLRDMLKTKTKSKL